jgi:hypothetical protein
MTEPTGGTMPDFKTLLLIVALGGGGPLLTYLGVAAPAQTQSAEVQAAAEILGGALEKCQQRNDELSDALMECRQSCQ